MIIKICAGPDSRLPAVGRLAQQALGSAASPAPCKSNPALPAAYALDQGPVGPEPAYLLPDQGAEEAFPRGHQDRWRRW